MPEWWTYGAEDLVPFAARSYWRMIESYNHRIWPLQVGALCVACALLWQVVHRSPMVVRLGTGALAVAWIWIGWAFLSNSYAQLSWAAPHMAVLFYAQGALLAVLCLRSVPVRPLPVVRQTGIAILAYAAVLHPLLAPLTGRSVDSAEVTLIAADPTALATLGIAMALFQTRFVLLVSVVPALWCANSLLVHHVLQQIEFLTIIAALISAGLAMIFAWLSRRPAR